MNQQRQRPMPSRLVVGMVIAAIGAILLLGNLGWFDAREVLRTLWPLALVAAGVAMLRDPKQRRGHAGAWVLITVGAALAGMAFGRIVSAVVDERTSFYPNWFYCVVEAVAAAALFVATLVG